MLYNPNNATDPPSEHHQMLTLYHPPLNSLSFRKRYITRIPHNPDTNADSIEKKVTKRMLATSDTIPNAKAAQIPLEPTLERALEASFTKAAKHASTYVIQALDLETIQHGTDRCPCPSLLDVLRTNDAEQKKIIHSCHIYTMQWLSERDISWCSDGSPVTNVPAWKHRNNAEKEPELVKAIGAWSVDLQCDCANRILYHAGRIDTIPCASHGLVDAKSCTSRNDNDTGTNSEEAVSKNVCSPTQVLARCPTDCAVDHLTMTIDADESGTISESSSETTTTSDLSLIDEQIESLLPFVIESIYARLAHTEAPIMVPDNGFGSSGNLGSRNAVLSFNEGTTGYHLHGRKRKRDCQGDGEDNDDVSENERGPPALRVPNPMPLEDPSARLACHFHVLDPQKYCDGSDSGRTYKTCPIGFKDSKELRDHHKKKHCGPKYLCARCHTEFQDSADKGAHEIYERCEFQRKVEYERERYILVGTRRRAEFERMKKSRLVSHEEHWFAVWRVLFPDKDPPASPYVQEHTNTAYFDQVVEEEILNCINGQYHLWLTNGYLSAATFLRHFAERLRERLYDETREGQLGEIRSMLGGSSSQTIPDDHRSTTVNTTSVNDYRATQHHAQAPASDARVSGSSNAGARAFMPSFTTQMYQVPPSTRVPIDHSQLSHNPGGSFLNNYDSNAFLHPDSGAYGLAYGVSTLPNHVNNDEYEQAHISDYPGYSHQ